MKDMEERMWRFNIYLNRIPEWETRKNGVRARNEEIMPFVLDYS